MGGAANVESKTVEGGMRAELQEHRYLPPSLPVYPTDALRWYCMRHGVFLFNGRRTCEYRWKQNAKHAANRGGKGVCGTNVFGVKNFPDCDGCPGAEAL